MKSKKVVKSRWKDFLNTSPQKQIDCQAGSFQQALIYYSCFQRSTTQVSVSPFGVGMDIFPLWNTTQPILHVESAPLRHAELSALCANVSRMWVQTPSALFQPSKWNTQTRQVTSGMQYRMKWGVFLVNLESWLGSQIQKVQGGGGLVEGGLGGWRQKTHLKQRESICSCIIIMFNILI